MLHNFAPPECSDDVLAYLEYCLAVTSRSDGNPHLRDAFEQCYEIISTAPLWRRVGATDGDKGIELRIETAKPVVGAIRIETAKRGA